MDVKVLKALIKANVLEKYDHRNLNLDVEEFKTINPTAENIARVVYENLRSHLPEVLDLSIRIYETERNFAEYPA
jgi:6-pyruvoyltetrahydropterin/6-carboxytetrahydropterin synthase